MNNVDFDELLKQGVLCGKKMVPVYCTTDLSIFKTNPLNRALRPGKVAESPFYRITRAFHVLMKHKLFAPEGVYKQEELMNQNQ